MSRTTPATLWRNRRGLTAFHHELMRFVALTLTHGAGGLLARPAAVEADKWWEPAPFTISLTVPPDLIINM